MDLDGTLDVTIELSQVCRQEIIAHCRRKLNGDFIGDESAEKKAFGLVAGNKEDSRIIVKRCIALKKNARYQLPYSEYMNKILAQHAISSETELDKRGWVADPQELMEVSRECQEQGLIILGAYHMHRVAWQHDATRDTPTELDGILAAGSRMIMLIVSMVDPVKPLMRAFYEGILEQEIPITFLT
jgi:proteasome lid subunit RPN8/RPN11